MHQGGWRTIIGATHLISLFQFLQLFQPRQHDVFTCLFYLSRKEYLIQDSVDLIISVLFINRTRKQHGKPYRS